MLYSIARGIFSKSLTEHENIINNYYEGRD